MSQPIFTEKTGAENPLDQLNLQQRARPTFVDIDGDGDLDLFVGSEILGTATGVVKFFENTGTKTDPVFAERTGTANPLDGWSGGQTPVPIFVDIDKDGDKDAFVGEYSNVNGTVHYYENTGSKTAPALVERTGSANPLGQFTADYSVPTFVDIDGDGDLDAFVGKTGNGSAFRFFRNSGSPTSPTFEEETGAANPLDGKAGSFDQLSFADTDGDGDADLVIGSGGDAIRFYENTGSSTNPSFTELTGTQNPFDGKAKGLVDIAPTLIDLNGDGNLDAVVGEYSGKLHFFQGTDITPPTATLSPADAGKVAVSGNLVLTFNEAIEKGTGNIAIHKSSDNSIVESIAVSNATEVAIGSDGKTVTINPATDLAADTAYYVTIDKGTFRDIAGNDYAGIESSTTWNFTVKAADAITLPDPKPTSTPTPTLTPKPTSTPTSTPTSVSDGVTGKPLSEIKLSGSKQQGITIRIKQAGSKEIHGTPFPDVIYGSKGSDRIFPGLGKNGYGSDRVFGGAGDDLIDGGKNNDYLVGGAGNDKILGGKGRDRVLGNAGNDKISGGAGSDLITGDTGNDTLTGGKGADMFICTSTSEGTDKITDFNAKEDVIDLRSIFKQSAYAAGTSYQQFKQFIKLESSGSSTAVKVDVDGKGKSFNTLAVLQEISGSPVTSNNFVIR